MGRRARLLLGLARAAHPGPSAVVALAVVGLGVAAGARRRSAVTAGLGVLVGQLSAGWANDWLDAVPDAASARTEKPVVGGAVPVGSVRAAALASLPLAVLLPAAVSVPAALAHGGFVASAWAYDLGLKRTPASALAYAVGFGTLPTVATCLRRPAHAAPWWASGAGAAVGIAAHLANVVADAEQDRVAGVRGLPQRLGATGRAVTAPLVLIAAAGAVAAGGRTGSTPAVFALGGCVAASALALGAAMRPEPGRLPFRAVLLGALCLVVALMASGEALAG